MFPVTLTLPPVKLAALTIVVAMTLLAFTLPLNDAKVPVWLGAFTIVVATTLLACTFPPAETALPVFRLEPVIFPPADTTPAV